MPSAKLFLQNTAGETVRDYDLSSLGFVPVSVSINGGGNFALTGPDAETGVVAQDGLDNDANALPAGNYTSFLQLLDDAPVLNQETVNLVIA